jgi:hypothetical protein
VFTVSRHRESSGKDVLGSRAPSSVMSRAISVLVIFLGKSALLSTVLNVLDYWQMLPTAV